MFCIIALTKKKNPLLTSQIERPKKDQISSNIQCSAKTQSRIEFIFGVSAVKRFFCNIEKVTLKGLRLNNII